MQKVTLVFIGGGVGASVRYFTTLAAGRAFGTDFPWGTLIVNLAGCFIIGITLALAERTELMRPELRLFFVTGFLGGLTTFSSYAMETVTAARGGLAAPLANMALNNAAGIALVIAGLKLTSLLV